MTLLSIGLMSIGALCVWLFRGQRITALLLLSIVALYALQPPGLELVLPVATLLLVVGVWWLITPSPAAEDRQTLLWISGMAVIVPMLSVATRTSIVQAFATFPPLVVLGVSAVAVGTLIPEHDERLRHRLAWAFIALIIVLLIILKTPALQLALTQTLPTAPDQPIPFDWQWLGFSYIAFRLMHVLLDYRHGRLKAIRLRDFALYVLFFPAILSGPIDRVEHFVGELNKPVALSAERIVDGATRIGLGLFKKFVLADTLAFMALSPRLIDQSAQGTPWVLWVMVYAYAFRIYFDFAGYTDIAIGIGILAGMTLPENFTSPYTQRNIALFWNNWHITLSMWFRNYFFTPLSRALMTTRIRTRRMLIILIAQVSTMVLIGLWHGVGLNFILWGAWHGLGLWLHRLLTEHTREWDAYVQQHPRLATTIHWLSVLATFHFVAIGWVFFALPDLSLIGKAFSRLLGIQG